MCFQSSVESLKVTFTIIANGILVPGGYLRLFADREGANVVASDHDCTSLTGESNSNCVLQFFFFLCLFITAVPCKQ